MTAAGLVHQLMEARDERRLLRLQAQLAALKLLIIDELGYVPLSQTGAELLFKMFSQRHERGSTIVTSNLPFEDWTSVFGAERLTGALLDRLTHHVHILEMNGESYRLKHSKPRAGKARKRPTTRPATIQRPAKSPADDGQRRSGHGYEKGPCRDLSHIHHPPARWPVFMPPHWPGFAPPLTASGKPGAVHSIPGQHLESEVTPCRKENSDSDQLHPTLDSRRPPCQIVRPVASCRERAHSVTSCRPHSATCRSC